MNRKKTKKLTNDKWQVSQCNIVFVILKGWHFRPLLYRVSSIKPCPNRKWRPNKIKNCLVTKVFFVWTNTCRTEYRPIWSLIIRAINKIRRHLRGSLICLITTWFRHHFSNFPLIKIKFPRPNKYKIPNLVADSGLNLQPSFPLVH